jgi:hypothetical protein
MNKNPIPFLVAAALTVAAASTLLVSGGWLLWLPILLALAVVAHLVGTVRR